MYPGPGAANEAERSAGAGAARPARAGTSLAARLGSQPRSCAGALGNVYDFDRGKKLKLVDGKVLRGFSFICFKDQRLDPGTVSRRVSLGLNRQGRETVGLRVFCLFLCFSQGAAY